VNYKQAIEYLASFQNLEKGIPYSYKKTHSLKRVFTLCNVLGRPQENFKSVLVGGTNAKGSICSMLTSVLSSAGYKTGLYTSPHLTDIRERIRINGKCITKNEFASLASRIKEAISLTGQRYASLHKKLTFFEILTALSFLYFSEKQADIAIIEVGLGGRLDATNIVYPLVSVIGPVAYDHMNFLGNTLDKIAMEKSGIVKENSFTVTAQQMKPVLEVIKKTARAEDNKLFVVGEDVKYSLSEVSLSGTLFNYLGIYENYKDLKLALIGEHQAHNGATSLAVLEILKHNFYFRIDESAVRSGFKKVRWPGRFDILKRSPIVIADGAHNKDAAEKLKKTLRWILGKAELDFIILGCSADKDIKGIGAVLCPMAKNVIFTKSYSSRAADPDALAGLLSGFCKKSFIRKDPGAALSFALKSTPKNGAILITGSLFLVGEAIKIL